MHFVVFGALVFVADHLIAARKDNPHVIFKAPNVMQSNLALPKIEEKGLRGWYSRHRVNYEEPARLDFFEAVLTGEKSDSVGSTGSGSPAR